MKIKKDWYQFYLRDKKNKNKTLFGKMLYLVKKLNFCKMVLSLVLIYNYYVKQNNQICFKQLIWLQSNHLLSVQILQIKEFGCSSTIYIKHKCRCFHFWGQQWVIASNLIEMIILLIFYGEFESKMYSMIKNNVIKINYKLYVF